MSNQTTTMVTKETVERKWYILDAAGKPMGKTAALAADLLRGKLKTDYTPHVDCGDYVIIINDDKVRFTGKKLTDKEYVHHTTYPGGQRFITPKELLKKKPIGVLEHAIRGMLPKNKLGDAIYRNLYVYAGPNHPHEGQQPKLININEIK